MTTIYVMPFSSKISGGTPSTSGLEFGFYANGGSPSSIPTRWSRGGYPGAPIIVSSLTVLLDHFVSGGSPSSDDVYYVSGGTPSAAQLDPPVNGGGPLHTWNFT